MIFNQAAPPARRLWRQFGDHEDLIRDRILAGEPQRFSRFKTEARVIIRVAEDEDQIMAEVVAGAQPRSNQLPADPAALVFGPHGQRGQPDGRKYTVFRLDAHRAEEDVTDDLAFAFRDERDERRSHRTQCLDEGRLVRLAKCQLYYLPNCFMIAFSLSPNAQHGGECSIGWQFDGRPSWIEP